MHAPVARGPLAALSAVALVASLLAASPAAHAQRVNANRNLPVNIDADRVSVDDRNKVSVFEGNVILTQGSMMLKGDRLVVTQDADGFQKGVTTGSGNRLASFRQKRANADTWIDGEAERIEYDSHSERAKLFNRAQVSSGGDLVKGQYIEYDVATENYLVAPVGGRDTPTKERVHVTLQPKGSDKAKPTNGVNPDAVNR
jgi:lipopolysaccharide export system protein LptA